MKSTDPALVLCASLSVVCILSPLAILLLPATSEADSHTVYVPLTRNAPMDDSLIWATVFSTASWRNLANWLATLPS